ncbi:MAG: ABC transporter permease [Acidimicrobiales bacterium]
MAILIVFALVCVVTDLHNSLFLSPSNISEQARTMSYLALVTLGEAVVLISGALDLSVGSIYQLSGVITAEALLHHTGVVPAIAVGLGVGLLAGAINGVLIVYLRIPALITTLGTLYVFNSISLVITKGVAVYGLPSSFLNLGQGSLLNIPIPLWIGAVAAGGTYLVLKTTLFGRWVYAIGGSERASFLVGLPIRRVRIETFLWSGLFSAAGGILLAGNLASAQLGVGADVNLYAIAAAIIGGVSLFGGAGTVFGCLVGTALVSIIDSSLVFLQVSPFYKDLFVGLIIIVAVGTDVFRQRPRTQVRSTRTAYFHRLLSTGPKSPSSKGRKHD